METLLISPASRAEIVLGKFLTVDAGERDDGAAEPREHGPDRRPARAARSARRPVGRRRGGSRRCIAPPIADVGLLDDPAPDPAGRLLQRRLPGAGRAGPEHEGGAVLHDAPLPRLPAPDLPDAGARDRAEPVLQPGAGHRGLAPAAGPDPGRLRRRPGGSSCRSWCRRSSTARSPCGGRSTSSSARTSCSARPSGSTCGSGSGTCSATRSRRPTGGEALFCFALMLTPGLVPDAVPGHAAGLATRPAAMAAGQVAFILTPPLAMAFLLTSSPRRTLRLVLAAAALPRPGRRRWRWRSTRWSTSCGRSSSGSSRSRRRSRRRSAR